MRNVLVLLIVIFRLAYSAEISYNLPNISVCAEWNRNGTTLPFESTQKLQPSYLFVDKNNSIYVMYYLKANELYKWHNDSSIPINIIPDNFYVSSAVFVSSIGDIYFGIIKEGGVNKWNAITNSIEIVAQFCQSCTTIFIDINDIMYCSMEAYHLVATKPLYSSSNTITIVAGVGVQGSEAHMLDYPRGIFVDIYLDLYVADAWNHRIQLFRSGSTIGTTIVGSSSTFKLNLPSSIAFDANKYMYIVDFGNDRIVAETSDGFQCILGCSQTSLSFAKLSFPLSMAFDSFGNIYVTDTRYRRVQKFSLLKNECNANDIKVTRTSTSATMTSTSTTTGLFSMLYMSALTTDHPTYLKGCFGPTYYYESILMHVLKKGLYDFVINSTLGVLIKIYKNNFDPMDIEVNLLLQYQGDCTACQIKFNMNLWPNETYYLIIASNTEKALSSFSVTSTGPNHIHFNQSSIAKPVQTQYLSELTINSNKCVGEWDYKSLDWYCEIIKIHTMEAGRYTIVSDSTVTIFGHAYENNFTLFDLRINKIESSVGIRCNGQFTIAVDRPMNTSFILIITADRDIGQADFSSIVHGPSNVSMERIDMHNDTNSMIQSNYSSYLNNQSQKHTYHNCFGPAYYFEALMVNVSTSGYYMFSSESSFDAYGYLYEQQFDPYSSVDTSFRQNDNREESNQFKITAYLHVNITYVLVITTPYHQTNVQGSFSVFVQGPTRAIMNRISHFPKTIIQSAYFSQWNESSPKYGREDCQFSYDSYYYYESVQINVNRSGNYTLSSISNIILDVPAPVATYGYLYRQYFNSYSPFERLLYYTSRGCLAADFKIITELQSSVTYILVVTTAAQKQRGYFAILASGPNGVTFNRISLQTTYSSELTKQNQVYPRVCAKGNYHYETIEVNVQQSGSYTFDANTSILLYGYIYKNNFDPSYPNQNLLTQSNFTCGQYRFLLGSHLEMNTVYILVVTTFHPNIKGSFTLLVTGPDNLTLNRIDKKHSSCVVGDQCNLYTKGIGLTINDILRNKIQSNISFRQQSALVQVAAAITMIMFIIGLINGIFSLITFRNKELRKVGCGIYLLASSITSLLTVTMFTIKFWFAVLIQLYSIIRSSILRIDCVFIGPALKLCLYLDGWLNACVAIERTVNVSKGVNFNQKKSRHAARWIILILPICIMGSIIHEPIYHDLFKYTATNYELINNTMKIEDHVLCVIRYSRSVQTYNTITLFIHLIVPFLANLCSALFIIFGTARQRSVTQRNQTLKEHVVKQMNEHKHLLISPIVLLLLATPRLIISLVSGCVDPSENPWLYLCAYFISFTPPMLIFVVFVLPSKLYRKTFKDSIARCK